MAFMQPEIIRTDYYIIDANHGERTFLPVDVHPGARTNAELADYVEGTIDDPESAPTIETGILGRLSAPGYMDCTPWSPYDTIEEAESDLADDDDDDDDDTDPE